MASDGDLRLGCVPRLVDCPGTRRELPYGNNGGCRIWRIDSSYQSPSFRIW